MYLTHRLGVVVNIIIYGLLYIVLCIFGVLKETRDKRFELVNSLAMFCIATVALLLTTRKGMENWFLKHKKYTKTLWVFVVVCFVVATVNRILYSKITMGVACIDNKYFQYPAFFLSLLLLVSVIVRPIGLEREKRSISGKDDE